MVAIDLIRTNPQLIIDKLSDRGLEDADEKIKKILYLDQQRKEKQQQHDLLAQILKQESKQIGALLQQGKSCEANRKKETVQRKKEEYHDQLNQLKRSRQALEKELLYLPNLPDEQVPIGKGAEENVIIKEWWPSNKEPKERSPHWELTSKYQLVNFEIGSNVSSRGFPFYTDQGARLQRGLINYFLDQACEKGYKEIMPPLIVNEKSAIGTGQLPDKEGIMYQLTETVNQYLIPTAEVPLTNMYREQLVNADQLPIKLVGYTPCFRREAGSWGREVRGLNRLHQFDKVEWVQITTHEQGQKQLEKMLYDIQQLLVALALPYRVLMLCSGDLGHTATITYDLEVWSTGQKKWLEVSSISLFKCYQARRMNLRYTEKGQKKYCYTLNGSGLALPRIIAALLEYGQQSDRIVLPQVLYPYLPFQAITSSSTFNNGKRKILD